MRFFDYFKDKLTQFGAYAREAGDPVFRSDAQLRSQAFSADPYFRRAIIIPRDNNPPMEHQYGLLIASIIGAVAVGLAFTGLAGAAGHFLFQPLLG